MLVCVNGEFKRITVDDSFPYDNENKKFPFSKSKENELWVLLLEKVWAKVNSTYENTITGYTSEAFRFLTGAPVDFYNHEYIEDIWPNLLEADK
jgi:calpain-15